MTSSPSGGMSADVIASLRANPVLASVSEEAIAKIADLVATETRAQVDAALRGVELFAGLPPEDLERIQRLCEPVVLDSGTTLFKPGDDGDRFYVLVRGSVELDPGGRDGETIMMEAGDSFGELALLSDAPRTMTARVRDHSYLITISRDAFLDALGGDSLAARLLRNVAGTLGGRAPSAGGVERSPKAALAEYNRMVRSRLVPRGMPNAPDYDLAARTIVRDEGDAGALWDWFILSDRRLAFAVIKVDHATLSSAHRMLTVRGLLRDFAQDPLPTLGALLGRVNRALRAAWVEGISGPVSCGVLALGEDGVEWASAGGVAGTVARADGSHEDLVPDAPSLGSDDDLEYRSARIRLAPGDHVLTFSDGPSDAVIVGRRFLAAAGRYRDASARMDALLQQVRDSDAAGGEEVDVTATLVTRRPRPDDTRPAGSDAIARAAAAFDATLDGEGGDEER